MNAIDFTPLYRSSIGFDRLATLINHALSDESTATGYAPYNIEILDENRYAITLAVAGFAQDELDIQIEKNILTIRGEKHSENEKQYLYQGIGNRSFERRFNLADYVEVCSAELAHGLLTINLIKEIPESMKPRFVRINHDLSPDSGEDEDAA